METPPPTMRAEMECLGREMQTAQPTMRAEKGYLGPETVLVGLVWVVRAQSDIMIFV